MAVAAEKRGLKRICMNCGTRFYDLAKRPIVCPSCTTEFVGDIKVKAKRGRAAAVAEASPATANKAANAPDEEEEEVDPNRQVVSLDEAAAMEKGDDEDEDAIELDDEDEIEEIDEDDEDLEEDLDIKTEKE